MNVEGPHVFCKSGLYFLLREETFKDMWHPGSLEAVREMGRLGLRVLDFELLFSWN